ncbi:putative transcription factor C2H2 family [Helianthus annuus]|uniref:Putative zinc finger, RING/FYVE/PHD-type n=1 Tax=Helianthus annuus TaxID=4232 RepID=A0A251TJ46_HELAN|nr:RING finger and transmembrane domain-containing protein 2 [Helianthus annuus]KAF5759362.1 putative transcription factor C2H2 family [Helianthus annuus]KAJ0437578.1 putative transcription factor C2H2 family [Helianthus annuus]KAJ0459905.1 putative transcription factor C2H2 family [Helianthus annuus]
MEPTTLNNLSSTSGRIGFRFRLREIIRPPLLLFLEHAGVFHTQSQAVSGSDGEMQRENVVTDEVSIRIMSGVDDDDEEEEEEEEVSVNAVADGGGGERMDDGQMMPSGSLNSNRYDIQNVAQWIEQILPFSLLLLVVLIRQHLQGFFGTIWISAVLFKSNDILQKQTALKGERKFFVLISISVIFMLHVVFVYWWYQNDDLMYPLVLLPPKSVPPFWHALFIILVNDSMARQAAMAFKCLLLMYYKNIGGHNYRKQGQMLTLVEYTLLLYRTVLPAPVWYQFFLNKEYGSMFSSITTGLYLTFKFTSVIQKVRLLFAALRALSRKELHYGSSASTEQVTAAGDLCAICQEKLRSPIMLRCKHIFCEECVSEWFDRERTCPLCRALVKPADIKSYSDGSTSLFFQFF